MTFLSDQKAIVKDYLNKLYVQEDKDVQYRCLNDMNRPCNKEIIDRLGAARFEAKRFAALLMTYKSISDLQIDLLHIKYTEFIEVGEELRKL